MRIPAASTAAFDPWPVSMEISGVVRTLYFSSGVVAWWALFMMMPGMSPLAPHKVTSCAAIARSLTPPIRSTRISPSASILRTKKPSWSMWAKTMTAGLAGSPGIEPIRLPRRSVRFAIPNPSRRRRSQAATRASWPDRPGISISAFRSWRRRVFICHRPHYFCARRGRVP